MKNNNKTVSFNEQDDIHVFERDENEPFGLVEKSLVLEASDFEEKAKPRVRYAPGYEHFENAANQPKNVARANQVFAANHHDGSAVASSALASQSVNVPLSFEIGDYTQGAFYQKRLKRKQALRDKEEASKR